MFLYGRLFNLLVICQSGKNELFVRYNNLIINVICFSI